MTGIAINLDINEQIKSKLIDLGNQKPQREQKIAKRIFSRRDIENLLRAIENFKVDESNVMIKAGLIIKLKRFLTNC